MKLGTRFFLLAFALVAIAVYQVSRVVFSEFKPRYREAVEENLVDTAYALAALMEHQAERGEFRTDSLASAFSGLSKTKLEAQIFELEKQEIDLRVIVSDEKGFVLLDSFNPENVGKDYSSWRDVYLTLKGKYGARTTRDREGDPASTVLYVSAPIKKADHIIGVLTVAKPTKSANSFIERAQNRLVQASVWTFAALVCLSALLSYLVSRPIRQLTEYARSIAAGNEVKLPDLTGGEVQELGHAFEEMREALEGKKSVERYVQALTHEIKSPLSAITGAAELLGESSLPPEKRSHFLSNIQAESKRIQQLIERLLELAGIESRKTLGETALCDIAALADEAIDLVRSRIERKQLRIEWTVRDSGELMGDRFLLRQSVLNVLENAIDFSAPGGKLVFACVRHPNHLHFSLEDEAGGIPDYALPRVTEHFFSTPRPDTGKKSSGIGLSFVAEVLKLHGGKLLVSNRTSGSPRDISRKGADIPSSPDTGDANTRVEGTRVEFVIPRSL